LKFSRAVVIGFDHHWFLQAVTAIFRRELWSGVTLVQPFRVPAPKREIVRTVFSEEDWPTRLDDPLPPQPVIGSKRQLHATIRSLERHPRLRLIHLEGDGRGAVTLLEELGPNAARTG
jgi:hypothetical protein